MDRVGVEPAVDDGRHVVPLEPQALVRPARLARAGTAGTIVHPADKGPLPQFDARGRVRGRRLDIQTHPEVNRRASQHLDSPKARNVGIDCRSGKHRRHTNRARRRIVDGRGRFRRSWPRRRRGRGPRPPSGRRLGFRIARRRRINLRAVGSIPGRPMVRIPDHRIYDRLRWRRCCRRSSVALGRRGGNGTRGEAHTIVLKEDDARRHIASVALSVVLVKRAREQLAVCVPFTAVEGGAVVGTAHALAVAAEIHRVEIVRPIVGHGSVVNAGVGFLHRCAGVVVGDLVDAAWNPAVWARRRLWDGRRRGMGERNPAAT